MKTIGMIGGMSWESTVPYYRIVNETVKERLGGLHSARLVLVSEDFQEIERLQQAGAWDEAGRAMADAARSLRAAGADFLVLCTNTMHKVADAIEAAVDIPLLHIADPTAEAIKRSGMKKVGLLGTRFTMEQDFYRGRLSERHHLEVLVPDETDRATIHAVIYEELCLGKVLADSRQQYQRIIRRLVDDGAEAIILGCTEIAMLIGPQDSPVPVFDTTRIHARAAAEWALAPVPGLAPQARPDEGIATIRPVSAGDADSIARIYNHFILNTIVTFEEQAVSAQEIAGRIAEVASASLPWLVAERDGQIIGYAYASKWKGRCAYRYSVESTVYLDPDCLGQGLGSALYERLFAALRERGMHVVIGGIALPNPASVALHERLGMKKAAHFSEVGFKLGKWIDVGYWQAIL